MSVAAITEELRQAASSEVVERLERLFSFEHGPEYQHDHPPGDYRLVDGPISVDEWVDRSPGNPRKGRE